MVSVDISVDRRPTIGRYIDRLSVDYRLTISRLSIDCRSTIGRQATDKYVDRYSLRPSILDRYMTDTWPIHDRYLVQTSYSSYKLYIPRTNFTFLVNFIFLVQLYIPRINFTFLVQALYSLYKVYVSRTNFIFLVQTSYSSYKLYIPRTNLVFLVQTLFSSHKLYLSHS